MPTPADGPATAADPLADLRAELRAATGELSGANGEAPRLERSRRPEFGDYSTNAALELAPALRRAPRELAVALGEAIEARLGEGLERVDVAGPGFLNLFMSDHWRRGALGRLLAARGDWGRPSRDTAGERVLIEFVSANPTGPITVASGRHAAYGDSLARVLTWTGDRVEREFYVNDHGTQVQRFGESIRARARGEEPPEDGYRGEYVAELAAEIPNAAEVDPEDVAREGVDRVVTQVRATLERFRVRFDAFFSERSLHESGALDAVLGRLEQRGELFRSEGALWLRTSARGDDKDRVLRRSSGEATYFAADVAYHEDKRRRGYDRAIGVLGADHHGYVARMHAAWEALGGDPDRLELPIMQLVNLTERGRRIAMSKREGEFVTLDELIDDIGVDAARFFLLQRSHDTTLDLDLALAREQSQDNPVYYVQYAHARIASILRRAGEQRVSAALDADPARSTETLHPSARALLARLLELPEEVAVAAQRRAPHRLTAYALEVAQGFSAFYRDCKVLGAAEEGGDEALRLALCVGAQRVIARSLDLLGVSAPEEM
jgi:arginyl-tRNA synthetase